MELNPGKGMGTLSAIITCVVAALLIGCGEQAHDYIAASSISEKGFARGRAEIPGAQGQPVRIWGFVDHGNIYGDRRAREILGDRWSGDGPTADSWRFNLKARADDRTGESFAVNVRNDAERDALIEKFLADARSNRPTKVFVQGRLFTFDAPANTGRSTGLYLEVRSTRDIALHARSGTDE